MAITAQSSCCKQGRCPVLVNLSCFLFPPKTSRCGVQLSHGVEMKNADIFKIWLATITVWLPTAWLLAALLLAEPQLSQLARWLTGRGHDDLFETLAFAGQWLPAAMAKAWPLSWLLATVAAVGLGLLLEHGARRRSASRKIQK